MKTLKQTSAIGLMGAVMIGGLPLSARADSAIVQTVTQSAVINGDNNQIIQVINQVNRPRSRGGRKARFRNDRGSNAVVQDVYQGATINGNGNVIVQETTQQNSPLQGRSGRRLGKWRDNDNDRVQRRGYRRWGAKSDDD